MKLERCHVILRIYKQKTKKNTLPPLYGMHSPEQSCEDGYRSDPEQFCPMQIPFIFTRPSSHSN
jgi:hypothetical protein